MDWDDIITIGSMAVFAALVAALLFSIVIGSVVF
jgi:hypothetical protein